MVKSRKSSSKTNTRGKTNASGQRNKFSVYEFDCDDERVEKDSRKILSKFKYKLQKFAVDKYNFLNIFAGGTKFHQDDIGNETLEIEDSDDNIQERISSSNSAVSTGFSKHERSDHFDIDTKASFHGARSSSGDDIRPGGSITDVNLSECFKPQTMANNKLFCVDSDDDQESENLLHREPISVDSDDDCRVQKRSSFSVADLSRDEGFFREQPSHHVGSEFDMEEMVVIRPDLIHLDNEQCKDATLAFSSRVIKLEASILHGTQRYFNFKWLISDLERVESFWYRKMETAKVHLHLKCEGEKVAESNNSVSGIQKVFFSVCDPHWSIRQEAIKSLDIRYESAWRFFCDTQWSEKQEAIKSLDTRYKAAWSSGVESIESFENIIFPEGDPDAVSISMKDIELLHPATFINDTIIDFYIKYLEQKIDTKEKHRFHFFNSFFFRKLADLDRDPSTACEGRAAFERVRKWTRKVNLFEKDYLFIPVNFSLHWSLIVICHPGEVAYFSEEETEKALKVPSILHLDSIRGSHRGLKNLFQSYLREEWRERHKELSEDVSLKFLNLHFYTPELPQQENSFDCGLFLLYYAERFLEQAPVNLTPLQASIFLNKEWFSPAEASNRRQHIKEVIYGIFKGNTQRDPPTMKNKYTSPSVFEGDIGKECIQEVCYKKEACQQGCCSASNSPKKVEIALPTRNLQFSGGPDLVPGDLLDQGDTVSSVPDGTYQYCPQMLSVNLFCNMSPVQEEKASSEQTTLSLVDKAFGDSGSSLCHKDEDLVPSSRTFGGRPRIALEMQDGENSADEVIHFSFSGERSKMDESPSMVSEKFATYVVEDSDEENLDPCIAENGISLSSESENCFMYD